MGTSADQICVEFKLKSEPHKQQQQQKNNLVHIEVTKNNKKQKYM